MKGIYLDEFTRPCQGNHIGLELEKQIGNFIDLREDVIDIEKKIKEIDPDYLILSQHGKVYDMDLSKFEMVKLVICGDSWKRFGGNKFKDMMKRNKITGFISRNNCDIPAYKLYFEYDYDGIWFPWGIDKTIVKDYGLEKKYDFTMVGKFSSYKYRREIHNIMSTNRHIKYHRRDVHTITETVLGPYADYCKTLNSSHITLGGCVQQMDMYKDIFIGNTFFKDLEIPACNSCLINSHWGDEEALGFKDGVNCITFGSINEFLNKLRYHLDDKEELMRITKRGKELVDKNYTIELVVEKFLNDIRSRYFNG